MSEILLMLEARKHINFNHGAVSCQTNVKKARHLRGSDTIPLFRVHFFEVSAYLVASSPYHLFMSVQHRLQNITQFIRCLVSNEPMQYILSGLSNQEKFGNMRRVNDKYVEVPPILLFGHWQDIGKQ